MKITRYAASAALAAALFAGATGGAGASSTPSYVAQLDDTCKLLNTTVIDPAKLGPAALSAAKKNAAILHEDVKQLQGIEVSSAGGKTIVGFWSHDVTLLEGIYDSAVRLAQAGDESKYNNELAEVNGVATQMVQFAKRHGPDHLRLAAAAPLEPEGERAHMRIHRIATPVVAAAALFAGMAGTAGASGTPSYITQINRICASAPPTPDITGTISARNISNTAKTVSIFEGLMDKLDAVNVPRSAPDAKPLAHWAAAVGQAAGLLSTAEHYAKAGKQSDYVTALSKALSVASAGKKYSCRQASPAAETPRGGSSSGRQRGGSASSVAAARAAWRQRSSGRQRASGRQRWGGERRGSGPFGTLRESVTRPGRCSATLPLVEAASLSALKSSRALAIGTSVRIVLCPVVLGLLLNHSYTAPGSSSCSRPSPTGWTAAWRGAGT